MGIFGNLFRKNPAERKAEKRISALEEMDAETEKIKAIYKEIARLQKIIGKKLEANKRGPKKKGLTEQLEKLDKMSEDMFSKLETSRKKIAKITKEVESSWEDYLSEVKAVKEIHEAL